MLKTEAETKWCPLSFNRSSVLRCCTTECMGWEPKTKMEYDKDADGKIISKTGRSVPVEPAEGHCAMQPYLET